MHRRSAGSGWRGAAECHTASTRTHSAGTTELPWMDAAVTSPTDLAPRWAAHSRLQRLQLPHSPAAPTILHIVAQLAAKGPAIATPWMPQASAGRRLGIRAHLSRVLMPTTGSRRATFMSCPESPRVASVRPHRCGSHLTFTPRSGAAQTMVGRKTTPWTAHSHGKPGWRLLRAVQHLVAQGRLQALAIVLFKQGTAAGCRQGKALRLRVHVCGQRTRNPPPLPTRMALSGSVPPYHPQVLASLAAATSAVGNAVCRLVGAVLLGAFPSLLLLAATSRLL
jgi:hypothetical protein